MPSQVIHNGRSENLTANAFTRTGYAFAGWDTNKNGGGTQYTDKQSVWNLAPIYGSTVTLYAQWTAKTYTVTYEYTGAPSGAADLPGSATVAYGTQVTIALSPAEVEGYTFGGWMMDNGTAESFSMPDHDVTITGAWNVNSHTVTYEYTGAPSGAADLPGSATVAYGTQVTIALSPAEVEGYTFGGWMMDNGTAESFSMPDHDVTITGAWNLIQYSIIYNLNNGVNADSNPDTYSVESSTVVFANATRNNYDFDGWFTDSGFTIKITEITSGSTGTLNLFAKWNAEIVPVEPPVPNTVTIYLPFGSGYSIYGAPSVTVEYGASYSFEVTLERAYDQSAPTVTANGKTVTAAGGIYSLGSVTEDTYITVSDVCLNVYAVVGAIINGTVTHPDQQVYYDTPSSEMVFTAADGYVITGYVINQKYTAIPSDGISTFTFLIVNLVTENIEITAITATEDAAENAVNAGIYIPSTAAVGATTWCASTVIYRWRTFGDAEGVRPVQQRRVSPAAGSADGSEQHGE